MNWQDDKRWSDRFLPEIKRILGEHLIGEASREEDSLRNTDLIVLRMDAVRIACRIRRSDKYAEKYGDEFTIRAERPRSGNETELTKIIRGYGDYFFYGFGNEETGSLGRWTLANLDEFRLWFNQQLYQLPQGLMPGRERTNGDGSSNFRVFRWSELPSAFVVASSLAQEAVA